ncbi:hypothetical protein VHEMI07523 [[Torrubiella] hemipterigena]|uniref:Utp8 beta-propeller domain-containing protein n=1 Tax=[Torrubiella] hemipterigena TaxID=1531966 RepID=A0A0A1TLI0_9HYPO|nr:hypothetical protein VHEMI07523 [[Torrubiella] hemipterigena]
MASDFKLHRPYVLATLPRPLDHTDGNIVVREVYGQRADIKKKKRTELAVGIDGENASIYDVPTSRLITSYPIPPHESFTCAPYSIRIRPASSAEIFRYTYIATKDNRAQKLTLFKDVVSEDGKTTSTTLSQNIISSPIKYITTSDSRAENAVVGDVIVLCENGQIFSLSGDKLEVQWSSSSQTVVQDAIPDAIKDFAVEYTISANLSEFAEGMFKKRSETFATMPKSPESDPEVIAFIATSTAKEHKSRHLVTMAILSNHTTKNSELQRFVALDITPIAVANEFAPISYDVDIQAGSLMTLQNSNLSIFDLTGAVPKIKTSFSVDNSTSIARLSRPFVLASSLDSLSLYNYQYRSVHAKAALDVSELPSENRKPRSCKLVGFVRSEDLAVALVDNVLVSIHVEPPKAHGKRRKEGLLIDSIGRGTIAEISAKRPKRETSVEFSRQVPGTMTETYIQELRAEMAAADELIGNGELPQWEELLRKHFHMTLHQSSEAVNRQTNGNESSDSQEAVEWKWYENSAQYPSVDRRWVIYALTQIFAIQLTDSEEPRPQLRLALSETNVTTYLTMAGHLTLTNLKSAFAEEWGNTDDKLLAGDLVQSLVDAEASMSLLLNYIKSTKLGEVELLLSIRALMLSMDFIPDTDKLNSTKLLMAEADQTDKYEMDLDDLERELAVTEHYLGDDTSSRSRGLTLAFAKLWRMPASATVRALRSTVRTEEILTFIYLLRMELVRGAWTTLYIDPTSFDAEGSDPPPDGVISLIADLLGRCLDAVGAGGWLFNDAMAWADQDEAGDFLTALRLEVTAALEGIEQAVHLNSVVGEIVRFGNLVQQNSRQTPKAGSKPLILHAENKETRMLPLGLKTKEVITKDKVVSGGEVVQRSLRETGHLISQKVESYSLERVNI